MMTETKDRIFGLDILRCTAIVFVLFSHTIFILPWTEDQKDFVLGYFGVVGVELFFILSGYLIGMILLELLRKRSASFPTIKYFWIRRWFRTLPAYYISLVLYATFYFILTGQFVFSEPFNLLYFVFLQNFFTGPPSFFRHSWSLSVEEWFYLMLPLWFLFFHRYLKRVSALQVIITGIIVFTLIRIIAVIVLEPDWNLGVRARVPLRLDTMMVGVLMGYIHLNHREKWEKHAKLCLVIGLLALIPLSVWMQLDAITNPEGSHFLTKTIFLNLFSACIALLLPYFSSVKTATVPFIGKAVTHISLISYSLYLIHTMVLHIYLTGHYIIKLPNYPALKFVDGWIACIVVATFMYRFIEKPFTNMRERYKLKPAAEPVTTS